MNFNKLNFRNNSMVKKIHQNLYKKKRTRKSNGGKVIKQRIK